MGGNFFTQLFGGGDTSEEYADLFNLGQRQSLDAITGRFLQEFGQGITPYSGQRVAGWSPLQQQAFGLAGGLSPGVGAGVDLFSDTMKGFDPSMGLGMLGQAQDMLGRATQEFDPSMVMNALEPGRQLAMNTFWQDMAPDIAEKYGATSGASGPMNKAMMEAAQNLSLGLGAQASPYLMQGYENQMNRQMQGSGMAQAMATMPGQLAMQNTQLGGMSTDLLTQLFNIGGMQRGMEQGELAAAQQQWAEGQAYNNPYMNLMNQILSASPIAAAFEPAAQGMLNPTPNMGGGGMSGISGGGGGMGGMGGGGNNMWGNIGNMFGGAAAGAGAGFNSMLGGMGTMIGGAGSMMGAGLSGLLGLI